MFRPEKVTHPQPLPEAVVYTDAPKALKSMAQHAAEVAQRNAFIASMGRGLGVRCDNCGEELHDSGVVLCTNPHKIQATCLGCGCVETLEM